ncbi:MAG: FtsX-like permease family protein [Pirellulales bacterium]|nr:FtsX-like permease family protein [Pirellulales bacterium]
MTFTRLLLSSLKYHWRMHLAVCCGVVVATAVLTGAFLVGDSMRGSLHDLTLDRLGSIDYAMVAPRFFREKLVEETADNAEFKKYFTDTAPSITIHGVLSNPAKRESKRPTLSTSANIIGCDERLWSMLDGAEVDLPEGRKVALSSKLAEEFGVTSGDAIVLRIRRPGEIPADATLGRKSDTMQSHRMTVGAVLPDEGPHNGPARFELRPSQIQPKNAFVSLGWLQDKLDRPEMVNTMLVAGDGSESGNTSPVTDGTATLERLLQPDTIDLGIRVERSPMGYCNITSDRMLISPGTERAIDESLAYFRLRPVLAYLANTIASNGKKVPYSTVAAIDFDSAGDGDNVLLDTKGNPIPPLKDGEIVLNQRTAERLDAKPGDTVELTYFQPHSSTGNYQEETKKFRLVAVAAMKGPADDRDLVPRVEGITDEATMADWDPPFPFDAKRIGDEDERYWEKYGPTPKAFVSLAQGRRLWAGRFGKTTSIQVTSKANQGATPAKADPAPDIINKRLKFNPAAMGFVFQPVKKQGLAASQGATSFEGLFIGFSFFIVAAAVLLVALLFRLGIDNRAQELGILAALGFRRRLITRLFLAEGLVVAGVGGVLGSAAGVLYAGLMIDGMNTLWVKAIVVPFMRLHVTYLSLMMGAVTGTIVASVAVLLTVRRTELRRPRRLLAGQIGEPVNLESHKRTAGGFSPKTVATLIVIAVPVTVILASVGQEFQAGAFFAAGSILLIVLLWAVWKMLRSFGAGRMVVPGHDNIPRLAVAGAARRPGRSSLAIGLLAAAFFLIVAVGAFRIDPTDLKPSLHSANGGFSLFVQTKLPVYHDLGNKSARKNLGFTAEELRLLDRCKIFSLRVHGGDDASCLNVYRPGQPRLLGLPDELMERGGFNWAEKPKDETAKDTTNPWQALRKMNDGRVPVVLERNTAKYTMHVGGRGTSFQIEDEQGRPVDVVIAGLLAASLFQGDLLMDESALLRLYPDTSGYSVFLVEMPKTDGTKDDKYEQNVATVRSAMSRVLEDYGATVETTGGRLASLAVVQNTYLSTFQSLGGLGLLLGTFGLAAVLMRNMIERRGELALLQAVGFRRSLLARMVVYENCVLLLGGLGCGIMAAILAVIPQLISGEAGLPWLFLLLTLVTVLVFGMLTGLAAFGIVISWPLMRSLRQE